jgi:hypothetical protein
MLIGIAKEMDIARTTGCGEAEIRRTDGGPKKKILRLRLAQKQAKLRSEVVTLLIFSAFLMT